MKMRDKLKALARRLVCGMCCDECARVRAHNNALRVKVEQLYAELDHIKVTKERSSCQKHGDI